MENRRLVPDHERKECIVLLSGGLDSATCLYIAKAEGYSVHALSFHYGQRHSAELESAVRIAASAECISHRIIKLDPDLFLNTALVRHTSPESCAVTDPEVPLDLPVNRQITNDNIPVTYVPARNILFLSHALALAESLGISVIFIGANSLDYSGYPDCRPEFLEAFEKMANLGTQRGVQGKPFKIKAPLLYLTKAGIIQKGLELGVDYSLTRSCYNPDSEGRACGRCDSCQLRLKGFAENGISDPAPYQERII